jgi:hypothetical protein
MNKENLSEKENISILGSPRKEDEGPDIEWKEEQEEILRKWADKGLCFKMMHERAHKRFWCLNAWFNIPVIIISTITGTGNMASGSFGAYDWITFIIGGFNIFAGILATIATYTGVAQKLEAHKFSSVGWDKFARKIQIELSKTRKFRVKAKTFIKQLSEEYDRLIEMSPILPNDIIRWFSIMVETGKMEDDLGECGTCCFECFCFPCGCGLCCINRPRNDMSDAEKKTKESWSKIELPEIIGRIKPTNVAKEPPLPIPETPPPLVIVENMDNRMKLKRNENSENTYDIYKLNMNYNEN